MVHVPIVTVLAVGMLTRCGLAFVGESITIEDLLEQSMTYHLGDGDGHHEPHEIQLDRCQFDAIDGPLMDAEDTDYEGSDIEGNGDKPAMPQMPSINHDGSQVALAADSVPNARNEKRKRRSSMGRRQSRLRAKVSHGAEQKGVGMARAMDSLENRRLVLPANVATSGMAASSGWVGRPRKLPRRVFTSEELQHEHGMEYFDWNGM